MKVFASILLFFILIPLLCAQPAGPASELQRPSVLQVEDNAAMPPPPAREAEEPPQGPVHHNWQRFGYGAACVLGLGVIIFLLSKYQ